ncbi:uncharacterized protein LOC135941192 [Cloeon dipterum]|uniref:uncharacterized protein LOC135941192 n=1 Tax=Cloeon dipterum TaxID=197152 RepID=UPI00321FC0E1
MKIPLWISNFILILYFTSPSSASFCSQGGFSKDQRESFFDLRCHCAESDDANGKFDDYEKAITSNMVVQKHDESTVSVGFDFPANPCAFQSYSVELNYVNLTGGSNGNCSNYHPENLTLDDETHLRHSIRKYHTSIASTYGPKCPARANLNFHHVFGGCYFVIITPHKEGRKQSVYSKPIYMNTSITKADVELMNSTVKVYSTPVDIGNATAVDSRFVFDDRSLQRVPTIASISLKLNILDLHGEGVCTRSGIEYDCCEIMNDDNSTFTCVSHQDPSRITKCKFEHGNGFSAVQCQMPINFIGNYCVLVEIKDDRCPSVVGDIWSVGHDHHAQSCIWHYRGYVPKMLPSSGKVIDGAASPEWYVWLILALVIIFALGFLFYYFYLLLRKGFLVNETSDEESNLDIVNTALPLLSVDNQRILLLYARDCDKFMDLMAHFREMITECCKREVIDLHHESYEQEMNQQGTDFLLELLRKNKTSVNQLFPEVTIVVVLTECGMSHHLAQMKGTRLEYKEPESLDSYFAFALKNLKEDTNSNMYNRVHVVEFDSFKVPPKSPEIFINALTRYRMPKHIKELVRALLRANNKSEIDVCEDSYKVFIEKIDELAAYKKENPDYLVSLVAQVAMNGASTQLSDGK